MTGGEAKLEVRKRLLRRLIWKAPLIIGLISFAVWWQLRQDAEQSQDGKPAPVSAEFARRITGVWQAEVDYPGRGKFNEQFLYQPEASKLFGTASFLADKHGIEDGRITGENFAFFIRYRETDGDAGLEHKIYYWGTLSDGRIKVRVQDDRGGQPIDFILVKNVEKSADSTASKLR